MCYKMIFKQRALYILKQPLFPSSLCIQLLVRDDTNPLLSSTTLPPIVLPPSLIHTPRSKKTKQTSGSHSLSPSSDSLASIKQPHPPSYPRPESLRNNRNHYFGSMVHEKKDVYGGVSLYNYRRSRRLQSMVANIL